MNAALQETPLLPPAGGGKNIQAALDCRWRSYVVAEILLDEFEAVRLCDHDQLSQIEAAARMRVSRGTVQRLLEAGRFKIADALLHDKAIHIHRR